MANANRLSPEAQMELILAFPPLLPLSLDDPVLGIRRRHDQRAETPPEAR
jgi:hypothetical protein